jgi:hypothetical protein
VDKQVTIEVEEIQQAMQGGDEIHEQEVRLKILEKKPNYYDNMIGFQQTTK